MEGSGGDLFLFNHHINYIDLHKFINLLHIKLTRPTKQHRFRIRDRGLMFAQHLITHFSKGAGMGPGIISVYNKGDKILLDCL